METKISEKLMAKGITPNLRGFYYLKEAVNLVIDDRDYLFSLTKRLYPEIAKKHDTTPGCVERAMRHALSKTDDKTTVGAFIGTFVEMFEQ